MRGPACRKTFPYLRSTVRTGGRFLVKKILRRYLVRAVGNRVRKAPVQREQLGLSLWFEELSVVHEQVQESLEMDMA